MAQFAQVTGDHPRGPGQLQIYRSVDGEEIAIVGATWHLNDKVTYESLAGEFRKNPLLAWRNYGSVIHSDAHGAVMDPTVFARHANPAHENPWDYMRDEYREIFVGRRGVTYYMHFDLSQNRDAVGIALVHRDGSNTVVDFMHRVVPAVGRDINYGQLREKFVYPLRNRSFRMGCISFDGFQSAESRQVLAEKGYETDYCSADRTRGPYDTLIEQILTMRCDYYLYEPFLKEMEHLQLLDGLKYDHPLRFKDNSRGSKDVSDAVACATFMAAQAAFEGPHYGKVHMSIHGRPTARYERGAF
jgi:hypothetical protein